MKRSYQIDDIRKRVLGILSKSRDGVSGLEMASVLNIARITTHKYLSTFASEGLIRHQNMGNVVIWTINDGAETFQFPDDYFRVRTKFLDGLLGRNDQIPATIIRCCLSSGAQVSRLMTDVIIPAITSIRSMYDDARMGESEKGMIESRILNCIKVAQVHTPYPDDERNVVLIAADAQSLLQCHCAEASYRAGKWQVYNLGDMSSSVNVLLDIDLPKFLSQVWRSRQGVMIILVLSKTEEGLNFFADMANSSGIRKRSNLYLALHGRAGQKAEIDSDIITDDLDKLLQWSETIFEKHVD